MVYVLAGLFVPVVTAHWIGGYALSNALDKRKIFWLCQKLNPQYIPYRVTDWRLGSRPHGPDATRPFVPHINLWEPCYFTKIPDGPQTYSLNVLWHQDGAQIHMYQKSKLRTHKECWPRYILYTDII
jgi:hypothetical protein